VPADRLERHQRDERPAEDGQLLLRGSPLSVEKFTLDAARTARAYTYQGGPCLGVSVELAVDDVEVDRLLSGRRLSTRHHVARIRVGDARAAGFLLVATFAVPHYTIVLGRSPDATVAALAELAQRDVITNPYYRR
jgi:hypothetical protein